jgi:hypothetical protein
MFSEQGVQARTELFSPTYITWREFQIVDELDDLIVKLENKLIVNERTAEWYDSVTIPKMRRKKRR